MAYWVKQGWVHDQLPLGVAFKGDLWEFHPAVGLFLLWGCMMVSKSIKIPKP
jgi:CDP-diacylglycerol--serine O-phosphatidyltransferase